jgi:cell division protease FtsH
MDGFESNEGVILLAATNRPDVLDPALLRPGRFDRQIVVDMPDVRGREMILKVHVRKIPLAGTVKLDTIAKATPGLAGADLANIVNEAALLAARRDKPAVDLEDLEDAKDKVMLGVERKSLVVTDEERELTAYHEAGHALVNLRVPGQDPVHKVTIVPRGRALGLTFSLPDQDRHNHTKEFILGKLATAYGGRVAEELIFGEEKITTGAAQDIQHATELARNMVMRFGMSDAIGPVAVGDREHQVFLGREFAQHREVSDKTAELVDGEVKRILDEAYHRAREILRNDLVTLQKMAEALLDRETLDRTQVELIVAGKELPAPDENTRQGIDLLPRGTRKKDKKASDSSTALGTPPAEPAGA